MISKKQRLDQILFNRNLVESKTKAQAMIMAGQVYVEGVRVDKSHGRVGVMMGVQHGHRWSSNDDPVPHYRTP